jgi:hypothetical protein
MRRHRAKDPSIGAIGIGRIRATDQDHDKDQNCLPHVESLRLTADLAIARRRYTARSFATGALSSPGTTNEMRP